MSYRRVLACFTSSGLACLKTRKLETTFPEPFIFFLNIDTKSDSEDLIEQMMLFDSESLIFAYRL